MQSKTNSTETSTQHVYWFLQVPISESFDGLKYLESIETFTKIANKYYFNAYLVNAKKEITGLIHLKIRKRTNFFKKLGFTALSIKKEEWAFYLNQLMCSENIIKVDDIDCEKLMNIVIPEKIYDEYLDCVPHEWQKNIKDLITSSAVDRNLWWYWESVGNIGKTVFTKHLCLKHDALMLSGASKDIKHGVTDWIHSHGHLKIAIFDLTRTSEEFISYQALEEVKNGMFFTTKYESKMVLFNKPHIIVFANFPPELWKSSMDRWKVIPIREESEFDYYHKLSENLHKLVNPHGDPRIHMPHGVITKLHYYEKCMDFWTAYGQKYRNEKKPIILGMDQVSTVTVEEDDAILDFNIDDIEDM